MNILESHLAYGPHGVEAPCAKFTIDTPSDPFVFNDVMTVSKEHILHFWAKTDTGVPGVITVEGTDFQISDADWTECSLTFTATGDDLSLFFNAPTTYYIYHLQLEQGNRATDWAPAPEDAEEGINNAQQTADNAQSTADDANQAASEAMDYAMTQIEMLRDRIKMMVVDVNGASLMTQTPDGWTFEIGEYMEQLNEISEYVKIGKRYIDGDPTHTDPSNVEPEIYLGESDTNFKARITNTTFDLMDSNEVRTSVDKDGITTYDVLSKGEFRQTNPTAVQGSGSFVWGMRQNGNYGLTWKEETS